MKTTSTPVRTTILFGFICGLAFIPLNLGLGCLFSGPTAFCMTLWIYLAAYGFLLTRWRVQSGISMLFPLLLIFTSIFWVPSISVFLVLALAIFSWIRSGICFRKPAGRRLLSEVLLSLGGGALVAGLMPVSLLSWSLGVWMFFLVQALYFIFDEGDVEEENKIKPDAFEQARVKVEEILSAEVHV